MTETTATRPARQRQTRNPRCKERFCKLQREPGGDFLSIREVFARTPDAFDLYHVEAFLSEVGGRGLELTKPNSTVYHVNLNGKASTCSCPGFDSHGWHVGPDGEPTACKHIMALLKLEQTGKL